MGTVSLAVDGRPPLSAPLSNGSAAFTINSLNAGDHTLASNYPAQGDFGASSSTGSLHVNPRPITVTADAKSKTYGAADPILTYQIGSGSLVNGASFTGGLTRAVGENAGTYGILQGSLALGANYALTYIGADLTITPAPTATVVSSASNPSVFGQNVLFTATVNRTIPGSGVPSGTVTFYDGAAAIGTATLNASGVAAFSTSRLPAGTHAITAVYGATNNFSASSSPADTQTVNKANTSTTLISSLNPSSAGTTVTFTAMVKAVLPGAGTLTGTITFTDGNTVLATVPVSGSGQAMLVTSALTLGVHSITAAYGGDANFTASSSASLSEIIYAYPVGVTGGAFAIGDLNAVVGNRVTFWGAQWDKLNSLSRGSAPASFKGFTNSFSPNPPSRGGNWTTRGGNSSGPPNRVPPFMAVIVSSSIAQSGSTISGDIVRMVVVQTAPGYDADPGHAGTGTVLAIVGP